MLVLLADDEPKVRSALRLLLEQEPGCQVVDEVAEAGELLAQVEVTCPDLLVVDWQLPGLRAPVLLSSLRMLCPRLVVIALSGRPEAREEALAAGADAFISKWDPPGLLLSTFRSFNSGE